MAPPSSAPLRVHPLQARWQQVHAASLSAVQALASPPFDGAAAAAASRWSQTSVGSAAVSAAAARRQNVIASAPDDRLRAHLDELDAILDEMHASVRDARTSAGQLAPEAAANRGPHGLALSPADWCAALAAPLRSYEAELALKRSICNVLCSREQPRPPAEELQALALTWESQPLLEPVEAMRRGLATQAALEAS